MSTQQIKPMRTLDDQRSIADLFDRCLLGLQSTRERWMETKPGIKAVWLRVVKDDVEKLMDIVRREEGREE